MGKENIEKLLTNFFERDRQGDQLGYISQVAIITIKSLMPMKEEEGVRVDYSRFQRELDLWFLYRRGDNPSLLNLQGKIKEDIYWVGEDTSIIGRVLPLVLANQKYEIIEDEIIKSVLFTSGDPRALFQGISLAFLLTGIVSGQDKNLLVKKLKEWIINFSQVEYREKYESYYRLNLETYPGNFKVGFEKARIQLLNLLNGVEGGINGEVEELVNFLNDKRPSGNLGQVLMDFINEEDTELNLPRFCLNLGEYIVNLRKSKIDPDRLVIKEYILPDIFAFKEGEVFFHSLLKEAKVVKKEVKDNTLTSLVQTKTGMYLFKK